MALYTDLTIKLVATLTASADLATPNVPVENTTRFSWATGTAANQADKMFSDTRQLAASATEDLDLSGALADGLGGTAVFARVKILIVKAAAANTNDVQVIRTATAGTSFFLADGDGLSVHPGGMLVLVAPAATGYPVTNSTDDTLTFTNSAGSTTVDYDVIIIGASA